MLTVHLCSFYKWFISRRTDVIHCLAGRWEVSRESRKELSGGETFPKYSSWTKNLKGIMCSNEKDVCS